jgi:hypothetical protein
MARMSASKVRRGDLVGVRGSWHEVKAVRESRRGSDSPTVVLVLEDRSPLRVGAGDLVEVSRGGREVR